jgi:hypothetical protein
MFKALPIGSTLAADRRHVTTLFRSVNAQKIGYGAGPMRPARASVFVLELPGGSAQVYVYLGLVEKGPQSEPQGLLFAYDGSEIYHDGVPPVVEEALALVGQQGFEMDRFELVNETDDRRTQLLSDLPFEWVLPFSVGEAGLPAVRASAQPMRQSLGTGAYAVPVEISTHISLPGRQTVQVIGRLLSLF